MCCVLFVVCWLFEANGWLCIECCFWLLLACVVRVVRCLLLDVFRSMCVVCLLLFVYCGLFSVVCLMVFVVF